jgi:hypothetical protein
MLSNMTDITGVGRLFCIILLLFTRGLWQHSDLMAVVTLEHWHSVSLGTSGFDLEAKKTLKWRRLNFEIIDL